MKDKYKAIVVSKENYNKLKELGKTSDSFNTVISTLIEHFELTTGGED
jgi:predicted CopG family antitoxin